MKRMLNELKNDFKRNMYTREDEKHLINLKNAFGQRPIYVAAKNGNLNIVELLIREGANPLLKS